VNGVGGLQRFAAKQDPVRERMTHCFVVVDLYLVTRLVQLFRLEVR
jgi:hypothetical protein